jgi:hypothetical protein
MKHKKHDLGTMLLAAVLLLFCVSYMTQCSSTAHHGDTVAATTSAPNTPAQREEKAERQGERRPKSIREFAAQEDREERERVQNISHALQTIGADPELRRTYGFPK